MRKERSVEERGSIIGMKNIGHSFAEISATTLIPDTTVRDSYNHYIKYNTTKSRSRSGRPVIFSKRDSNALLHIIEKDRRITIPQIISFWPVKISRSTIRRMLHKLGLRSCIPRKKPNLSIKQMKSRLQWAIERKNWGIEDWKKVIWTDESSVEIGENSAQVRVWRHHREEWDLSCLLPTFRSGRTCVMVWGCIAGNTLGPLVVIPRDRRTGVDYRNLILEGPLIEFYKSMNDLDDGYFIMEDGAPIHRSMAAREFRAEKNIKVLPWPAQSPDLNPIENVWHMLKSRINRRPRIPRNEIELTTALQEEWKLIPLDHLSNTVESMPERIKMVISKKGGHCSY